MERVAGQIESHPPYHRQARRREDFVPGDVVPTRWKSFCRTVAENTLDLCGFYQVMIKNEGLLQELQAAFSAPAIEAEFFTMLAENLEAVGRGRIQWGEHMKVDSTTFTFRLMDLGLVMDDWNGKATDIKEVQHTLSIQGLLTGWRFAPLAQELTTKPLPAERTAATEAAKGATASPQVSGRSPAKTPSLRMAQSPPRGSPSFAPSRSSAFSPPQKRTASLDSRLDQGKRQVGAGGEQEKANGMQAGQSSTPPGTPSSSRRPPSREGQRLVGKPDSPRERPTVRTDSLTSHPQVNATYSFGSSTSTYIPAGVGAVQQIHPHLEFPQPRVVPTLLGQNTFGGQQMWEGHSQATPLRIGQGGAFFVAPALPAQTQGGLRRRDSVPGGGAFQRSISTPMRFPAS